MRATTEHHLYRRGKRGTFYLRLRIPTNARYAYPEGKAEIVFSLKTGDEKVARKRLRREFAETRSWDEEKGFGVGASSMKASARATLSSTM